MRIRLPFAGAFIFLLIITAYLGLSTLQLDTFVNDKVLHCVAFFILTTCFYWILDTTRRRNLNLTLLVCTAILGVGSEFLQRFLPIGRIFDAYDILANIAGSLVAVALSSWYHKRMLERKRVVKQYTAVPGEEEADLELGEGVGAQESGVIAPVVGPSLESEVDNWDENAEDAWDEDGPGGADNLEGEGPKTPSASSAGETEHQPEVKKRVD